MKDIELPPMPQPTWPFGCKYNESDMRAYARAAVEADRAQRVPDRWPNDADLTAIYKQANGEDVGKAQPLTTQRIFKAMRAMLASTPAPAQRECWCETCDLAQGNPLGRTRMSLCPECGDKRCPRAKHHDNACAQHQEPPKQERKPMTDEINQCDGCRRGLPLKGGMHTGPGMWDKMVCQKHRYGIKE